MPPAPTPTSTPRTKLTRAAWLTLAAAFLGWMFDGLEMGIFPLLARPAFQEMLGVTAGDETVGIWMGAITATFLFGAAFGGLVFGWLGDRIGRVRAMSLSILIYSLFTGACYFVTAPWQMAALRFVSSLGMGGEWALGVTLVMETWPEKHRPWLAAAIGAASNIGLVVIGVIAYLVPVTQTSWRWLTLIGAAPALLTFLIRLFVPESPRWQQAVAAAPVANPLVEIVRAGYTRTIIIATALASVVLVGIWGSVQWIPLWTDQLTSGQVPEAKAISSMLIALGAVVGSLLAVLCSRISRRFAFFALCLLSLVTCAWLFRGVSEYGALYNVLTFAVGATTAAFFGWLPLYLPELFPTRIRATAQGFCFNFGRIIAGVGALGAGQLVNHYRGDYAQMCATITLVYIVGAALIWLAPETKGNPLPA